MAPDSGVIPGQLRLAALMTADPAARRAEFGALAEPGSPMPDVFEALSTAALQKLRNSQGFARPPWAVVCEARCTAAHQKLQL